jgi:hypothetical protein
MVVVFLHSCNSIAARLATRDQYISPGFVVVAQLVFVLDLLLYVIPIRSPVGQHGRWTYFPSRGTSV